MKLKINHIKADNFRCFDDFETDLWNRTIVEADNESGKTTIATAILWCLTGKDTDGNSNFEIVPTGKYGEISPSIELECTIDDKPLTLKREYKANFARDKSFKDYTTVCYINGIECGARKFQDYISKNICDEAVFKIISNPYTFVENCPKEQKELMWQAQRRLLMEMVEQTPDYEIAQEKPEYELLVEPLQRYDSINQYIAYLKQETSKKQKEANSFESKLEQQEKNIIPVELTDEEIEKKIREAKAKLEELESKNDKHKAEIMNSNTVNALDEINKAHDKINEILGKYNLELKDFEHEKSEINWQIDSIMAEISEHMKKQAKYADAVEKLKQTKISTICETCGQRLTEQMIEQKKNAVIKRIKDGSQFVVDERNKTTELSKKREELTLKVAQMQEPIYPRKDVEALQGRITKLSANTAEIPEDINIDGYIEKKEHLQSELDLLQKELYNVEQNKIFEKEIQELEENHRENLQELNKFQMLSDLCKDFVTEKCKMSEEKINSLFKTVKFQLFEKNKTNDEIREICNLTFNGHKYEDLSASTKLVANLELLSAFQKHYNTYVPIVIDNMESITADIINEAQTIQMYVKEELCPKCGDKSGRRKPNGLWECESCHNEWQKEIEIKEER